MTTITAIELENFQSIAQRTRIELRPITLLFGPNSAGKSAVFDALELLRAILDRSAYDEKRITDMVNRWAGWRAGNQWRETRIAIEFPFVAADFGFHNPGDICFDYFQAENLFELFSNQLVRIELLLKVRSEEHTSELQSH